MLFYIAKEDCSGGPVVSGAAAAVRRDECGVCGGTGDTCLDCFGVTNGGEQLRLTYFHKKGLFGMHSSLTRYSLGRLANPQSYRVFHKS